MLGPKQNVGNLRKPFTPYRLLVNKLGRRNLLNCFPHVDAQFARNCLFIYDSIRKRSQTRSVFLNYRTLTNELLSAMMQVPDAVSEIPSISEVYGNGWNAASTPL